MIKRIKPLLSGLTLGIILMGTPHLKAEKYLIFNVQDNHTWGHAYLLDIQAKGTKVVRKFPTTYGLNGIDKRFEGDKRTPTGVYKVTQKLTKPLDDKFGGWSFPVDYPNALDRNAGRTGGAIAIHGGRVHQTLGCMRILDGTLYQPQKGTKNIAYLAAALPLGSKLVVMDKIPQRLLAVEGNYLHPQAADFWRKEIIHNGLSRQELRRRIRDYRQNSSNDGNSFIQSLLASSVLDQKNHLYGPQNLIDQNETTAWVIKPTDWKKTVEYKYKKALIFESMRIDPGYRKALGGRDLWKENARPSLVKVSFDDGHELIKISDQRGWKEYKLKKKHRSQKITFQVLKWNTGKRFKNEVCISGLEFNTTKSNAPKPTSIRSIMADLRWVEASSSKTNYGPKYLVDGNPNTAWVVHRKNNKKRIVYSFNTAKSFKYVVINAGYDKKGSGYDRWIENGRPATLRITFDDGKTELIRLKKHRGEMRYRFKKAHESRTINVEVLSTVKGKKYPKDVAISELYFQ